MNKRFTSLLCAACILACALAPSTFAKDNLKCSSSSSSHHQFNYAQDVKRDAAGHIARDSIAKADLMRQTGYPHGRAGYVVDHNVSLRRGGAVSPSNMQWPTKAVTNA